MSRVTMNVTHVNPDASVNFTVIGIGKDRKEASVFALGSFVNVMDGDSDDGISDYNKALEMVNEIYTEEEIKGLMEETLKKDSDCFFNAYESTSVDYSWDEVEGVEAVGLIQEMQVTEY